MAWKRITVVVLFVCAFHQASAPAQEGAVKAATRFTVYGGYSWLSDSFNNHSSYSAGSRSGMNGWDADASLPLFRHFDLEVEGLGFYDTNLGIPEKAHYFLAGPKVRHGLGSTTLFAYGLLGLGHLNSKALALGAEPAGRTNSIATDLGAGLDFRIAPRVAWRVQGGELFSAFTAQDNQINGLTRWFGRVSTGVVLHF